VSGRPPSRPRTDAIGRIAALEAEVARLKAERSHDADQMGEMLVRVATVERTRAAAENRAVAAEMQAGDLGAELAQLKARCAQLEAEAWEAQESSRQLPVDPDAARDAATRVATIIDELERREEMAAGLRARTLEQMRQALAEIDSPKTPPGT
jgi:chromosome segregation ATPase